MYIQVITCLNMKSPVTKGEDTFSYAWFDYEKEKEWLTQKTN